MSDGFDGTTDFWFLNSRVSVVVARAGNADGISVLRHDAPFGEAPPWHVHHDEDEIFHVVEGEVRFRIGDATVIGRAGETVLAPRAVPHGFRVVSPGGACYLTITRGGFESVVRAGSRPAAAAGRPPFAVPTPAMQAALAACCAAQGIDLLGPPIE